jgi:hypothetical protein
MWLSRWTHVVFAGRVDVDAMRLMRGRKIDDETGTDGMGGLLDRCRPCRAVNRVPARYCPVG